MEKKGTFHYIPSGVFYENHSGIGIYVKYKPKRTSKSITIKEYNSTHVWLQCPDRDIVLVYKMHQDHVWIPSDFDEYVHCAPTHLRTSYTQDLPGYMINYHQQEGKGLHKSPRYRRNGLGIGEREPYIISDSGGFQIISGIADFINPKELALWYNDNVDMGMVLDLPLNLLDTSYLKRVAKIQKANTDMMLENLSDKVSLLNIYHGLTDEGYRAYANIVKDERIDRLAISSSYLLTTLKAVDRVANIISEHPDYKQYHILGVSNILQVILFMRMGALGIAEYLTSDSSSWIQNGVAKKYIVNASPSEVFKVIEFGDKENFPNPYSLLPCTCPVCSAIKYSDVLRTLGGTVTPFLVCYHNFWMYNNYFQQMEYYTQTLDTVDLKDLMQWQFKGKHPTIANESIRGLDYLDSVVELGVKEARKKYRPYLSTLSGLKADTAPNNILDTASAEQLEMQALQANRSEYLARCDATCEKFEKFHGI